MAGRYLATELQDENGDVIYPHTEADIVFTSDGKTVEEHMGGEVDETDITEIFNGIQPEIGSRLSVKEKIKKAFWNYLSLFKMRVLDSVEEVEANTDDGYMMGAKAGAEIINNLAQQPQWIKDSTGKITGYTTQEGGAGSVFPFSGTAELLWNNPNIASQGSITVPFDFFRYNKVIVLSCASDSYTANKGITICDAKNGQYVMVPYGINANTLSYGRKITLNQDTITISPGSGGLAEKYNIILKVWGIIMDTDFYEYP